MTRQDSGSVHHSLGLALIAATLFGSATPASKWLLGDLSAFQLAGLLYLGAALGVVAVLWRRRVWRAPWRMAARSRRYLFGAVLLGGIIGPVLLLLGLQIASASSVSLWLNLELVATAVFGRLFFRDHLGKYGWLGVIGVVTAGVMLAMGEGIAGVWAGLLVAGACACWGLDNHFTALIDGITPAQSTFWKGLIAGTANLTIGVLAQSFSATASVTSAGLILGILAYGASITLYIAAAQGVGATRAQMFFASAPFIGVVLSALLLGESISPVQVGAALLLILSLSLLFRDQHEHRHVHEALSHEHSHRHDDNHHDHPHVGSDPAARHTHWHDHEPVEHAHPHWPDLHHRHRH